MKIAVNIGAEDYFAIMVLAFIAVTAVLGASRVRGFASLALGLMIGLVGIDATTGQQRMTFGLPLLADGIDVVVVAVGHLRRRRGPVGRRAPAPHPGRRSSRSAGPGWAGTTGSGPGSRGCAEPCFGFPFGALPAGGAEIPTFLSYVTEKKLSKHPEEFGHGAIEGVAGPEATNNASAAGTLVPMLALGLPVSATAAVMLAAFQTYGIQPGPLLFDREPELVWGLIASLFIGNALLLVLNLPLAPFWAKLLSIPRPYLYAGIIFFASLGAYAVNAQAFDLVLLLVLGALGFAMRRFGLPVLPAIIGVILGPRAELQLRRALQISGGEVSGLFTSAVAIGIYVLIALILLWPLINRYVVRRFRRPAHEVHHGHTHALVELAEELAADSEHLSEDESVLARARPRSRAEAEAEAEADNPDTGPRRSDTPPRDPDGSDRNAPDQHSSPDRKAKT